MSGVDLWMSLWLTTLSPPKKGRGYDREVSKAVFFWGHYFPTGTCISCHECQVIYHKQSIIWYGKRKQALRKKPKQNKKKHRHTLIQGPGKLKPKWLEQTPKIWLLLLRRKKVCYFIVSEIHTDLLHLLLAVNECEMSVLVCRWRVSVHLSLCYFPVIKQIICALVLSSWTQGTVSFFSALRSDGLWAYWDLIYSSASACQSLIKTPLRGLKMDVGKCVCVCVWELQWTNNGQREIDGNGGRVKHFKCERLQNSHRSQGHFSPARHLSFPPSLLLPFFLPFPFPLDSLSPSLHRFLLCLWALTLYPLSIHLPLPPLPLFHSPSSH